MSTNLLHLMCRDNDDLPRYFTRDDDLQTGTLGWTQQNFPPAIPNLVTASVACACAPTSHNLHVCSIYPKPQLLMHTERLGDGSWPFPFGEVLAETAKAGPNPTLELPNVQVALATNQSGDLHLCVIDGNGGLWHTMRLANGQWPLAFGDVQAQTRKVGPNPGIGPIREVACATNQQGDLHICVVNAKGDLFHTVRSADGRWPFAFGDVESQTHRQDPFNDGSFNDVACATDQNGTLIVCAMGALLGRLWWTFRRADGSWGEFRDVLGLLNFPDTAGVSSISISHT